MDDPQELLYAGNEILGNYQPQELETLKEEIFCISLCEYTEEKKDNFDSWRLYGDNGFGVGIVFHFSSNTDSWLGSYLSKIHYGKNEINKNGIEDKIDLLSNTFGRKGKIPEWLAIFLAFHKSSLYTPENEVRFLRYGNKYGNHSFTLNQRSEKTSFDKLFIKTTENLNRIKEDTKFHLLNVSPHIYDSEWIRQATSSDPIVVVEKIIIGYRRTNDFENLNRALYEGFNYKTGQLIGVELSPLSEAFV